MQPLKTQRNRWSGQILKADKPVGRVVSTHISVELNSQVERLAVRLAKPKGWVVRQALENWMATEGKRLQNATQASSAHKPRAVSRPRTSVQHYREPRSTDDE